MAVPEGMSTAELRVLFDQYNAGNLTLDEINDVIRRRTGKGYADRSGVFYLGQRLGMLEEKKSYHEELIPWKVKTEHNGQALRRWLGAEARHRGRKFSPKDKFLRRNLQEALFPEKGLNKVVDYDPNTEEGFRLVRRRPTDRDIIRAPQKLDLLRGSLRTRISNGTGAEVASLAFRIGLSPALLHRAGRHDAADLLDLLLAEENSSHDVTVTVDVDANESNHSDSHSAGPRRLRSVR